MKAEFKQAFTLLELMVVMSIISVLSVIGVLSIKGNTDNRNLQAAVYELSALMGTAHDMALTYNTTAYLLINKNSADKDKYLRYAIIVYQNESVDSSGTVTQSYVMGRKGLYLPQGIYFDTDTMDSLNAKMQPGTSDMLVDYDVANPTALQEGGSQWLAYKFSPGGTCSQAGTSLVLASGNVGNSVLNVGNSQMRDGFVVQRLGSVVFFQNLQQILSSL
jgi:prepilin-type N-terminal cleavage/methylation domain-containing protein